MVVKHASRGLILLALAAGVVGTQAQAPSQRSPDAAGAPMDCAALSGLAFDRTITITSATLVTSGTLVSVPDLDVEEPAAVLPRAGREQAVHRLGHRFEVWLPQPATWNAKFLSTGEGGFAGTLNYQRNGLDGGMDELLRRGYATASTDTGHRAAGQWWAVGHPERRSTTSIAPST